MDKTEQIIYDNLFRVLRKKHFDIDDTLTAMTPWKWRQMELLMLNAEQEEEPYSATSTYQLMSRFQEHTRAKIFDEERHAIDTSIETLGLLNLIIYNVDHIERHGISLPGIITIGHYLRQRGDKSDYVKLDNWIKRLHIKRMCSLISTILLQIFHFEADELPFLYKEHRFAKQMLIRQLSKGTATSLIGRTNAIVRLSPLGAIGYLTKRTRRALDSIEE